MDLLKPRVRTDPQASARIRAWAIKLWAVAAGRHGLRPELRCAEPGCSPIETVVVISPRANVTFQRKVHKGYSQDTPETGNSRGGASRSR